MIKLIGLIALVFLLLWAVNYVEWSWPKLNDKGKALWAKIKKWFGFGTEDKL